VPRCAHGRRTAARRGIGAGLVALSIATTAAQTPTRIDVVRPEHQIRLSREACGMAVQAPVKTAYSVASPSGLWSAFVQETDPVRVPYDQARACIRLQRRDGPARYLTVGDFRALRVEWLDDRRLHVVTDVGRLARVSQLLDVETQVLIRARTEYVSQATPPSVEALLRSVPSQVPGVGPVVFNRFGGGWTATYRSLSITVDAYDTSEAAEVARGRSEMTTPMAATRRETVDGRTLTWWRDGSLLGRAGRFVVNLSASRPDDISLVRKVFDYVAPELEKLGEPRPEEDLFVVVRGEGYHGAVVPAASPWHDMFKTGLIELDGGPGGRAGEFQAWTPGPDDIAALERDLKAFVASAAREPARVTDLIPPSSRVATTSQLPWLQTNLAALKRQYYGLRTGGERRVLLHGFQVLDGSTRWRSEPIFLKDGGCGNVWFEVHVDQRRVVRFVCGGVAAPATAE
jgi:hypothetical protein